MMKLMLGSTLRCIGPEGLLSTEIPDSVSVHLFDSQIFRTAMLTLQSLLTNGYFPKELPPVFTTTPFAVYVLNNPPGVLPASPNRRSHQTRPSTHYLARPDGHRRRLQVPTPFAYHALCDLIVRNWGDIVQHCDASSYSLSKPIVDPNANRALRPEADGSDLALHRARVRATSRFVLRTDISRYYGSIYTHAIPWALLGKAASKAVRRGGFANDLDELLRNMQDGQTLGIPISPDTSLVVAEILASAVDREIEQRAQLRGFRFMDDFEFGFVSRASAEAALATLEIVLSEFELAVNPRKTAIVQLPVELERDWTTALKGFEFVDRECATNDELIRYFDLAFAHKAKFPTATVLSYAIARLRGVTADDWNVCRDLLLQCALVEPGCFPAVVTELDASWPRGIGELNTVIGTILEQNGPLSHGSELTWALWAACWFNVSIEKGTAEKLDGNEDPFVALLTLYARSKGLVGAGAAFPKWEQAMQRENLYDTSWVLAYEADLQGWLPSAEPANHVDADPLFGPMKAAGVSFMNLNVAAPTQTLLNAAALEEFYNL
jgi:hypothetical protein